MNIETRSILRKSHGFLKEKKKIKSTPKVGTAHRIDYRTSGCSAVESSGRVVVTPFYRAKRSNLFCDRHTVVVMRARSVVVAYVVFVPFIRGKLFRETGELSDVRTVCAKRRGPRPGRPAGTGFYASGTRPCTHSTRVEGGGEGSFIGTFTIGRKGLVRFLRSVFLSDDGTRAAAGSGRLIICSNI